MSLDRERTKRIDGVAFRAALCSGLAAATFGSPAVVTLDSKMCLFTFVSSGLAIVSFIVMERQRWWSF